MKKQLRRQNKLAGLTPRGAHIAGLSAVHIHRNLGFENVVQCFVKYIHHVRDTIPPGSPNMVAVLTVHVRHVKNARGWPFVFKNLFFLKLGFLVSYYVWINWN